MTARRSPDPSAAAAAEVPGSACVLVVDEHDVARYGLRVVLGREAWVRRCLPAGDVTQALALCRRFEPHAALVDGAFAGADPLALVRRLRELQPTLRVLMMSDPARLCRAAVEAAGGCGVIAKDWPAERIVGALRLALAGRPAFPAGADRDGLLSAREFDVLALLADGMTNREIATRLARSPHTVKQHTQGLYRKLSARNRAEAVRIGQQRGLLT